MQIKAKLKAVALLPLLAFVMATAIESRTHGVIEGLYAKKAFVGEVSHTTMRLIGLTYEYGITHGERAASQWRSQYVEVERSLQDMPTAFARPADDPQFETLRRSFQNSGKMFSEILAYDNRQDPDGRRASFTGIRNNMVNRLILELQDVAPLVDSMQKGIDETMQRSIRQGSLLTIAIFLSLALSLLALAFLVTHGIYRSLFRLQQGVQTVAGGDLGYRVNLEIRDELGDLGRGFDAMTEKLAAVTVSRDALVKETAERRLAEEALIAREAQLKEAQRLAQLGSWDLDLTTNTLRWSDEIYQIFEIDQADFADTYEAFLDAIHPEDRAMVNRAYVNSLETKTPYEVEHRLLMQDGRIKFMHERGETRFDSNGSPLHSFGTVQDISGRRQGEEEIHKLNEELEQRVAARTLDLARKTGEVEETQRALMNIVEDLNQQALELEEANHKLQDVDRLKSMFIAAMSHELRTPLNSVIGFSSIVLGEWLGPLNEEQKGKMAIVLRTGKHLLALINDLIDISKIEAGKLESISEEFDLFDLITEAAGITEAEAAAKGIAMQVEAIHLPMQADRRRLYQCVVNLMSNAIKFTRAGTITLKAALVENTDKAGGQEMVSLSIRDTGIGIKEEDLPKLFTSFVRLPLPEGMQAKGTGLGLYLVKKIATEILGGTVRVTTEYGQGSEFCLTVPVSLAGA